MALFSAEEAIAHALGAARPHVSFKAGRMNYEPSTGLVTADPRKGVLQVVTAEDSLTHLQWRTRPNGEVDQDHDLIVFPGETEMKRVRSSPGRVYVLKWSDASTRMFFWMQDGDESADAGKIERLNAVLQNGPSQNQTPPVPPSGVRVDEPEPATMPAPAPVSTVAPTEKPPTDAASAAAPSSSSKPVTQPQPTLTMEALSRMLDALPSTRRTLVSVGELLRHSDVVEAAQDADLSSVYETLPEAERNAVSVEELLRTEAVQAQALSLTRALYEASAAEVLPSLGLPAPDNAGVSGIKALIEAVKKAAREKPSS